MQKLKLPQETSKLRELLVDIEVNLLTENDWHLRSLKKRLPRLLAGLYKTRGTTTRARESSKSWH